MGNSSLVYLALGDSMSHDRYPEEDALAAFGRRVPRIGAASLLYENSHDMWPEFDGRDLLTRHPTSGLENRSSDGANIDTVLGVQLPPEVRLDVWLATLTVGGNDLLELVWDGGTDPAARLSSLEDRYTGLVEEMKRLLPGAKLILSTTYDPTDGTGTLPGVPSPFPIQLLERLNDHVRRVAAATPGAFLADVHAHFRGHGAVGSEDNWWYLPSNPIEPRARGANEIRRVWWDVVDKLGQAG